MFPGCAILQRPIFAALPGSRLRFRLCTLICRSSLLKASGINTLLCVAAKVYSLVALNPILPQIISIFWKTCNSKSKVCPCLSQQIRWEIAWGLDRIAHTNFTGGGSGGGGKTPFIQAVKNKKAGYFSRCWWTRRISYSFSCLAGLSMPQATTDLEKKKNRPDSSGGDTGCKHSRDLSSSMGGDRPLVSSGGCCRGDWRPSNHSLSSPSQTSWWSYGKGR